jgi:hypothetical protein
MQEVHGRSLPGSVPTLCAGAARGKNPRLRLAPFLRK